MNLLSLIETSSSEFLFHLVLVSVLGNKYHILTGFPRGSDGKESACNVGNPDLIPGSGRSPGEALQYSRLENSMDRERSLVGCSPWGHKESDTT